MGRIKMLLISRLNGDLLRWANRRLVQVDEDLSKLACVDREHDSADSKSLGIVLPVRGVRLATHRIGYGWKLGQCAGAFGSPKTWR